MDIDTNAKLVHRLQELRSQGATFLLSFGPEFLMESAIPLSPDLTEDRWVLPHDHRHGLRFDLAGRRVAVIGNGVVRGCGPQIDSHEEVIRITTMRHWRQCPVDDGTRITLWAGHPQFVVDLDDAGRPRARDAFARVVAQKVPLWVSSPYHLTLPSYCWLAAQGGLDRMTVTPPALVIQEMLGGVMDGAILAELSLLAPQIGNLVGRTIFDLLLTGTRLVTLLMLSGVREISLFGFDLFTQSSDTLWWGHKPELDRRVLMDCKRILQERGGHLHWHEEGAVMAIEPPSPTAA
jgi:hypothetical protein